MCVVGGHWEITGCVGMFLLQIISFRKKQVFWCFSGVFDISSATWSIVSPIPDYGVARGSHFANSAFGAPRNYVFS
jgi:hypothetical protein